MNVNLFNILMILGSAQGVFISALLYFSPQYRKTSNLFLSILVLTISVQNISNSLIDIGFSEVEYWPLSWTLLIPFSLKYFVTCLIKPTHRLSRKDYLLLSPFALQLAFKLAIYCSFLFDINSILNNVELIQKIMISFELIALIWCLAVAIHSIKALNRYQQLLTQNFSNLEGKSLSWLRNTLVATLVICCFWGITFGYHIYVQELSYFSYLNWISIALITYWLAYSIIARRNIFEAQNFDKTEVQDAGKRLPEKSEEHYQKILKLMTDESLYREEKLNMDMLSERLQLSNGYVSQIINQKTGKNFFEFINEYRVKEVIRKMQDANFNHFSLLGIALDSGFTSKSTFNDVFKRITGLTPSAYQKQLK